MQRTELLPPPALLRAPPPFAELRRRLRRAFTALVIRPVKLAMERAIRRFAPDGTATFFEPARFPWVAGLEASSAVIRIELERVLQHADDIPDFRELSPGQSAIVSGGAWKSFFLYLTGQRVETGCRRCPRTAVLLSKIPGIESAFFSVLEGGTHLTAHRGPYGGVLRYHLALVVPGDGSRCKIRVGADVAHWREGRSLIFDDSHEHEAENLAEERRVVLFVDFARPLPAPLAVLNRWLLRLIARAEFVDELRKNLVRAGASPSLS